MTAAIFILPLAGAFIGYVTNYLAIKMLFHPKQKIKILFISIQGLFPKRQRDLARKLGQLVSGELFSVREVTQKLADRASSDEVIDFIEGRIKTIVLERLSQNYPMIMALLSGEVVGRLAHLFIEDIRSLIQDLIDKLSTELEQELKVQQIVEEKVAAFSGDKLEEILFLVMKREFRFIEWIGAVLGFLIGLVQLLLLQISF